MIGRSLPPQIRPTVLLVLLSLTAAAPAARAQDATTQARLERIERDLSMLQRQVYRGTGGEAPPGAELGGSIAVDLQVRMDRIEQQMRDLTGRVEDETNQLQQLRQRLEQVNADFEVRAGKADAGAAAAPRPAPPPIADMGETSPYGQRPPTSPPPGYSPYVPPGFGTLTPPSGPMPATGTEAAYGVPSRLTTPQVANAGATLRPPLDGMPPQSAAAQYNSAYGLLRKADYPAAEEALRAFIEHHPNDPLVGNAQYWLGQSYYESSQFAEAAAAFAEGYKRYPRGPKAPDSLLGLGRSLARANQKHNACIALMQLDHDFPHPGTAIAERAAQEKKKLGC
jgi:tol-pal system protein YbgF